jgi:hypothetical protein
VVGWKGEATGATTGTAVDLEDPGDGLVLQPFPGVALMDACPVGKLTGGDGAVGCQSAVQPQLVSDVDVQEVKRSDAGSEQPLRQRPRRLLLFHSPSLIARLHRWLPVGMNSSVRQ